MSDDLYKFFTNKKEKDNLDWLPKYNKSEEIKYKGADYIAFPKYKLSDEEKAKFKEKINNKGINNIKLTEKQQKVFSRFIKFIYFEKIGGKVLYADNGNGLYNAKKEISKDCYYIVINRIHSCDWDKTKEGDDFWNEIDKKWCGILNNELKV